MTMDEIKLDRYTKEWMISYVFAEIYELEYLFEDNEQLIDRLEVIKRNMKNAKTLGDLQSLTVFVREFARNRGEGLVSCSERRSEALADYSKRRGIK